MSSLALLLFVLVASDLVSGQTSRRRMQPAAVRIPDAQRALGEGCPGRTDFELITGFVYSSAEDIIDSKAGTLFLQECLDHCRTSDQCQAVNFETGLCVLFKTAAGENTGALATSQFPVFTLYAQKICLEENERSTLCDNPWQYETVPGLALLEAFSAEIVETDTRFGCALACIQEERFVCRAASYQQSTRKCVLSQVDRNMAGRKRLLNVHESSDYLEVACVNKPDKMCEFRPLRGRIMKTVDSAFPDVTSREECEKLCLGADYNCYTYDFGLGGDAICRLSHHSSSTLAHIQEPYLDIENSTTYERKSCYQVSVECKGSEMVARVSTSTLFDGKIYAKARPNSCFEDVVNSTDFEIVLPYNDIRCDVVQDGSESFSSNIVIQHHDMIVTSADVGLALHCKYDLKNQTVTNTLMSGLEVKEDLEAHFFEETIVASPKVAMRVTDPKGEDVLTAQVGADLALRFEILDAESPYKIFVRDLVAMDGQDSSEIQLIDENGCPTDASIMQAVIQIVDGKVLHAPFQAFKFPSSDVVQFRGLVTPCLPHCEPAKCDVLSFDGAYRSRQSFGRRKKREASEHDILLAQSVRITDKFDFKRQNIDEVDKTLLDESCSSMTGIIVASALFLVAQIVILLAWSYLWHKKRSTKQLTPHPTPSDLFYSTMSSRGSSSSFNRN